MDFVPAEVRCAGLPVTPRLAVRPVPVVVYSPPAVPGRMTLDFRIDETGRPLSIGAPKSDRYFHLDTSDVAPALAAWRFAPGAARTACTIAFALEATPVATAPAALVHRAFALPHSRQPGELALRDRLRADNGDCAKPRYPAVRVRAYPAFDRIPQAPGSASYAMVGFDIDASGKPRNLHIQSSDGNAALDRAAIKAVRDLRFAPGARKGCNYPYHRRQNQPMPAPMLPPTKDFQPAGSTCPPSAMRITELSASDFPAPFGRRSIEGVAIIGYDVAPWGAVGNVKVLASEPAAAFGEVAQRVITRGTPGDEVGNGLAGCVARIVFRLPQGG